jgi:hypothetical protein
MEQPTVCGKEDITIKNTIQKYLCIRNLPKKFSGVTPMEEDGAVASIIS